MKIIIPGRMDGLNEYTNANRDNPYAGAGMKKKNENLVIQALKANGIKNFTYHEPVYLRFMWVEPNRRRDKDNIASAKKFCIDALVKAGVLENDGWKHIIGFSDRFAVNKENPHVEIEILTAEEMESRRSLFISDFVSKLP